MIVFQTHLLQAVVQHFSHDVMGIPPHIYALSSIPTKYK